MVAAALVGGSGDGARAGTRVVPGLLVAATVPAETARWWMQRRWALSEYRVRLGRVAEGQIVGNSISSITGCSVEVDGGAHCRRRWRWWWRR